MRKITLLILAAIFILTVINTGCTDQENTIIKDRIGTINYIDLEGGFYGITDEDGNKYDPINLEGKYKEDGLQIKFSAEILEDYANIHMWGTIIEITSIQEI